VGVNRVPPSFARPRDGAGDPLLGRAAPANPVDVRRDEPVAASVGRSPVRCWRRSCAVSSPDLMQSAGCRARPPSSGRSTRQRRNVKRSRRPPGATRRVPRRGLGSIWHPEHGEAFSPLGDVGGLRHEQEQPEVSQVEAHGGTFRVRNISLRSGRRLNPVTSALWPMAGAVNLDMGADPRESGDLSALLLLGIAGAGRAPGLAAVALKTCVGSACLNGFSGW
jgi:hypothetical protein